MTESTKKRRKLRLWTPKLNVSPPKLEPIEWINNGLRPLNDRTQWRLAVLVERRATERRLSEISFEFWHFVARHRKPNLDLILLSLRWIVQSPRGTQHFGIEWLNVVKPFPMRLWDDYCRLAKRSYGVLKEDLSCDTGVESFSLWDCHIFDERELIRKINPHKKLVPGNRIVALAKSLFSQRGTKMEDVEVYEFLDDEAAHDDALQQEVCCKFERRFASLKKLLSDEFGPPALAGHSHRDIHVNTALFAMWEVPRKTKRLFLGMSHEDRELPYVIVLGTC